jgi:hypothetical protein
MPRTSARRRRNPDPPETLAEYFEEQVAGARKDLETRIPHVSFDDFSGKWGTFQSGLRDLSLNWIPFPTRGTLYLISAYIGKDATANTVAGTARALVRVSDELRLPILLHEPKNSRLPRFEPLYDEDGAPYGHLHLPKGIPSKVEDSILARVRVEGSVYSLYGALEELAMYHFLVPEEYREQIGMLAQQAFENDDLAAYLQARELAALVSE